MPIDNGKVFDDESDRWITRLEGETDRDALLRNRAESGSRKPRQFTRSKVVGANPYAATLWIFGASALVLGAIIWTSAAGILNNENADLYASDLDAARWWAAAGSTLFTAGFPVLALALLLSGLRWVLENVRPRR